MSRYLIGNWLFLIGCLIFTLDAILGLANEVSFRSICQLSGCILFSIGCVVFILDAPNS